MGDLVRENPWVWIVVMDSGGTEQFVGQQDQSTDLSFLPAFLEKEEALKGLERMTRDEGHTYEVQAIRYEDLAQNAAANGFRVFILNGEGKILEKNEP